MEVLESSIYKVDHNHHHRPIALIEDDIKISENKNSISSSVHVNNNDEDDDYERLIINSSVVSSTRLNDVELDNNNKNGDNKDDLLSYFNASKMSILQSTEQSIKNAEILYSFNQEREDEIKEDEIAELLYQKERQARREKEIESIKLNSSSVTFFLLI